MQNSIVLKSILLASGLIPIGVGAATLLAPVAFYASSGIELGNNISLMSEIKGPAGALLAVGGLVLSGAFNPRMAFTSTIVSTSVYLGYGAARVLSMAVDGAPSGILVGATVGELLFGVLGIFALTRYRNP